VFCEKLVLWFPLLLPLLLSLPTLPLLLLSWVNWGELFGLEETPWDVAEVGCWGLGFIGWGGAEEAEGAADGGACAGLGYGLEGGGGERPVEAGGRGEGGGRRGLDGGGCRGDGGLDGGGGAD
jgi:hypothetical protein